MNYRSISDMNNIILKGLNRIPRDFDLIVGIPRSGMLPANLLALYLNKPYTDIHSFKNGHIYKAGARSQFFDMKDFKKILVVDDSVASGSALNKSKELLKEIQGSFDLKFCAIYVVPDKENSVDFFFESIPLPRSFQWNVMNHTMLEKACFDIDGVLCIDPTEEQNDDGPKYIDFILNAPPLFIPGCKIGTLVTSRLEKFRKETETWLENNNVKYNNLVMLDLPNKEARQRANNHASHKANTYKSSSYVLFVESDMSQAIEINRLTGKPVLCTETFQMIYDAQSLLHNIRTGKSFPFLRKIAMKLRDKIRDYRNNK